MTSFDTRLSPKDIADILGAVRAAGHLDAAPAVVVHHLGVMRSHLDSIRTAFPAHATHAVAIKANPVLGILREAVAHGAALEAASLGEVRLALAAGCLPEAVIFDSPAKTAEELREALTRGLYINADSLGELERIAGLYERVSSRSRIGLRINPMVGRGAIELTSLATADSHFGVSVESHRDAIHAAFARYPWLRGLHVHTGSQGYDLSRLTQAVARVDALRRSIADGTGVAVTHVDIGGGLPARYDDDDAPQPVDRYATLLREAAPGLFSDAVHLVTEFGRSIQAPCGVAFSRVECVKRDGRVAVIHLGSDLLVRPVYRPTEWRHEVLVFDKAGRLREGTGTPATVAGPLCFAGDIVARDVPLPPVAEGDWVAIRDVGGYTMGMWSRYCSRPMPAVLGYDPDAVTPVTVLRAAESPDDIVAFWDGSPRPSGGRSE